MSRQAIKFLSLVLVSALLLTFVPKVDSFALALSLPDKDSKEWIKLNKYSIELKPRGRFQLKAEVLLPDMGSEDVRWRSSEPLIASVDRNGMVTAFDKRGVTHISASAGGVSVYCTVYVPPEEDYYIDDWKDKPVNRVFGKSATQYNVFQVKAAVGKSAKVKVSWKKQKKVKCYELQRAKIDSGKYKTIAKQKDIKYTDRKVKAGTRYKYRVCCVRTDGTKRYSCVGEVRISGKTSQNEKPETPSCLKAELHGSDAIGLKWAKTEGADGYCVYRHEESEGSYKPVKIIYGNKKTKWMDENRKLYHIYEYKVAAFWNEKGNRIYSKKSYPVTVRTYKGDYTKLVNAASLKIQLKGQDGKKKEMNIGSQISAKAVIEPEYSTYNNDERLISEKIKWSSSDESILKVDKKGVITSGTKEGICTIYARAHNGITKGVKIKVINFAAPTRFTEYKRNLYDINRLLTTYSSEIRDIATYFTIYGKKGESGVIRLFENIHDEHEVVGTPDLKKISLVKKKIQKIITEFPILIEIEYNYNEVSFKMIYSNFYETVTYSRVDRFDRSSEKMAPHWKYYRFAPI